MKTIKNELNPLYVRVDDLCNFSEVKPETPTEEEEYPHLEKVSGLTAEVIKTQITRLEDLEKELEEYIKIIERETGDDKSDAVGYYNKLLDNTRKVVERINKELITFDTPYFGKIIFETEISRSIKAFPAYIGKFAMVDPQTYQPLISDWRSHIANLYYEKRGPKAEVY